MSQYAFPFEKITKGSNIVVYGAGVVGTDLLKTLRLTGYCNVTAVLDRDRAGGRVAGYSVLPPENIRSLAPESYDIVLAATNKNKLRTQIFEFLTANNIPREKIMLFNRAAILHDSLDCRMIPDDGNNVFRMAIVQDAGFGDIFIMLPLILGLRKAAPSGLVIDHYARHAIELRRRVPYIDRAYHVSVYSEDDNNYDAVINGHWLPYPQKLCMEKAKRISAKLHEYLSSLLWHYENVFNKTAGKALNISHYGQILGLNRIEFNNPRGILQFDRDTPQYVEYDCKSLKLVEDKALSDAPYITICDDVSIDSPRSLKLWPKTHFSVLTRLIKERYPQYRIVRLGTAGNAGIIENIDVDLSGHTTIDELCAVLKHSVLHIGCEGGLVHLKHSLNGVSACLFGTNLPEFFGYDGNLNLRSGEPKSCSNGCAYVGKNWGNGGCLLDCDAQYAPCMVSLTPEYVFEHISKYLDDLPHLKYEQYGSIPPDKIETIIEENCDAALIYREGDEYMLSLTGKLNSLIVVDRNLSEEPVMEEAPINMSYRLRMQSLGVQTEYGNMYNIPSAAGKYDLTVSFTIPEVEYREFALREMARITKSGGVFAVMTDSGDLALYRIKPADKT